MVLKWVALNSYMSEEEFHRRFRESPIKRAKLTGLQRNACTVLGNMGDPKATPALLRALTHSQPLVRGHAAWALGRMDCLEARDGLNQVLKVEEDPWVSQEIMLALNAANAAGTLENPGDPSNKT